MLSVALDYYKSLDPELKYLSGYENYKKLDMARTERIGEEYARNHP